MIKSLLKSIFVTLPRKAGATECELHPTIGLMSHKSTVENPKNILIQEAIADV